MSFLLTLTSLSGGGKSQVFEYIIGNYASIFPMKTYTSRPKRFADEGGYIFKDKQYFLDHADEFKELSTYPPHSDPREEGVHYYGKHSSQFDGNNYVMAMDEVGVETLRGLARRDELEGYELITVFVDISDEVRISRIGDDPKRLARDAKRELLPLSTFEYIIDNNGTLEELYSQVDALLSTILSKH
jgi:guanylate kinase